MIKIKRLAELNATVRNQNALSCTVIVLPLDLDVLLSAIALDARIVQKVFLERRQ